jgi:hypothetical protein
LLCRAQNEAVVSFAVEASPPKLRARRKGLLSALGMPNHSSYVAL